MNLDEVALLARQFRADSVRCTTSANAGHLTSSLSAADIVAVFVARHFQYDWNEPGAANNDRFVLSKGHASPLLYSAFKAAGVIGDDELVNTYRRYGSRLLGDPTPALPWVEAACGSLGQGVGVSTGMAIAGKYLEHSPHRIWVLCGDSEMSEGAVWEALDKAGFYRLNNLVVIVDVNRLGQRGPTQLGWDTDAYSSRVSSFGCRPLIVDGHDIAALDSAFLQARAEEEKPIVILAKTIKGRGIPELEDKPDWHAKPLPEDAAVVALEALGPRQNISVRGPRPPHAAEVRKESSRAPAVPSFAEGEFIATRDAFGKALVALGEADDRIVVVDGEVGNSTFADAFGHRYPGRFFEAFMAEQELLALAIGLARRGFRPFASTFAGFVARAADFARTAPISRAHISIIGSHGGVEVGSDGEAQMGLEDIAILCTVRDSIVFYPSDAQSVATLLPIMATSSSLAYMRTSKTPVPVLYAPGTPFVAGGAHVVRRSPSDDVTLVSAGIPLHTCLRASELLAAEGVGARVIDAYSIKPLAADFIIANIVETASRVVIVEDHYPQGGLGSTLLSAIALSGTKVSARHIAIDRLPGTGSPEELLAGCGISPENISLVAASLARA